MAFRSDANALESRRAVAGLMGLAMGQGFLAATTDHFDLTDAVAGRAPLAPRQGGGFVPAPDVLLLGSLPGVVIGVEVETRPFAKHYPGCTFAEVAKLRDNLLVDVVGSVYARHLQGSDVDCDTSWRQHDIQNLMDLHAIGLIDFITSKTGETLFLLHDNDLDRLDALWRRLKGAA